LIVRGVDAALLRGLHEECSWIRGGPDQSAAVTGQVVVNRLIEATQVGKDQLERLRAEEGRAGILEGNGGNEDFPSAVAVAPSKLAATKLCKLSFGAWRPSSLADHQLPQVLLPQAKMQAQSQQQERSRGLGCCSRIEPLIRHQSDDLLGDLPVFANRARRFQDRQDGFEWIAVNTRDAIDFRRTAERVLVHRVAHLPPIGASSGDVCLRHEAADCDEALANFGDCRIHPVSARVRAAATRIMSTSHDV
jgi:hypothetical protein